MGILMHSAVADVSLKLRLVKSRCETFYVAGHRKVGTTQQGWKSSSCEYYYFRYF